MLLQFLTMNNTRDGPRRYTDAIKNTLTTRNIYYVPPAWATSCQKTSHFFACFSASKITKEFEDSSHFSSCLNVSTCTLYCLFFLFQMETFFDDRFVAKERFTTGGRGYRHFDRCSIGHKTGSLQDRRGKEISQTKGTQTVKN